MRSAFLVRGFIALTIALAASVSPTLAQQPPSASSPGALPSVNLPPALDRVLRDYEQAWAARDASALASLFTPDGVLMRPGAAPVRGKAAIEAAYRGSGGPLVLRAFAYAFGDSAGWILGGYTTEAGKPDLGKFTLALLRAPDGRWLIASDMDNGNQPMR